MYFWGDIIMKAKGYDYDECCYKEMSNGVGGQSEPQDYHEEPMRNEYEINRKSHYGEKGIDWSGMKK